MGLFSGAWENKTGIVLPPFNPTRSVLLLLFWGISSTYLHAQDFTWWNETHQWDGHTSWQKYMVMSPKFLGPNALPVPESTKGRIAETGLDLEYDQHFQKGEQTHSIRLHGVIRLFSNRVALDLAWIGLEYYKSNEAIRDLRASRDFDGEGTSTGDLYIGTHVKLLQDHHYLPDVVFNFTMRTASGSNLEAARFTDTPGYYFDLSAGRDFRISERSETTIRPFFQAGLYVWQTYEDLHRQNDAILYGMGSELKHRKTQLEISLRGYHGYLNNGDRPLIWLSRIGYQVGKNRIDLVFEKGLHDYPFNRLGISGNILF